MREEGFADIYVKTRGMSVRIPGTFAGKQAELFAFLKDFWPEDNHRLTGVDTGLKTHPVLGLQGGLALFTPQRRRGAPGAPSAKLGCGTSLYLRLPTCALRSVSLRTNSSHRGLERGRARVCSVRGLTGIPVSLSNAVGIPLVS